MRVATINSEKTRDKYPEIFQQPAYSRESENDLNRAVTMRLQTLEKVADVVREIRNDRL